MAAKVARRLSWTCARQPKENFPRASFAPAGANTPEPRDRARLRRLRRLRLPGRADTPAPGYKVSGGAEGRAQGAAAAPNRRSWAGPRRLPPTTIPKPRREGAHRFSGNRSPLVPDNDPRGIGAATPHGGGDVPAGGEAAQGRRGGMRAGYPARAPPEPKFRLLPTGPRQIKARDLTVRGFQPRGRGRAEIEFAREDR